jgi:hypothetical protein
VTGCPRCRSDRLKSAPLPGVDLFVASTTGRHRYRCGDCGWTGWKHRLRRRSGMADTGLQRASVEGRAIWFAGTVLAILVITAILLVRGCEPAARPDVVSKRSGIPTCCST